MNNLPNDFKQNIGQKIQFDNKFEGQSFKPQSIVQNQNQFITPQNNDQSFQNCNKFNMFNLSRPQCTQQNKKDETNIEREQFFQQVCNANVQHFIFFQQANEIYQKWNSVQIGFSIKDFNPKFNRTWKNFNRDSEERGPNYHRYQYFYPKTCFGYGLQVNNKYKNDNWLKKDGNPDEWRILYHGIKQQFVAPIVKNGLQAGAMQAYKDDICRFTNQRVGVGIYFSDKLEVCRQYHQSNIVGNKKINVYFMSRVRPSAIRQSVQMQKKNYFVVNNSEDIRPYRILLEEV